MKLWSTIACSAVAVLGMAVVSVAATPVPVAGGKAALTPDNTRLQFVCAHLGDKPDPRTGTFGKFTGTLEADPAAKTIKSIALDFDATSLNTEFAKLTTHLKSPDFFDTREHPKASFVSKKITPGSAAGEFQITGDLTLHGVTKSITLPAKATFADGGVTVTSDFTVDRSEFGMKYGLEKVDKKVSLTVVIGEKNKVLAEGK
ncbi:MAG TPA: YceI family protein [Planctomycetaceae bacterium]|nr:YceI family protein [Planctomycetaceae bacterium]